MMEFIMDILSGAENAAIIVGLILAVNLGRKAVAYGKENTDNEKVKRWMEEIERAFETAVKSVNQTLVDSLKFEGNFDAAAQKKAREEAKTIFLRSLSDDARVWLRKAYAFSDSFINAGIEKAVANAKNEKQGTVLVSEGVLVEEIEKEKSAE